jgi:hypothetical protein
MTEDGRRVHDLLGLGQEHVSARLVGRPRRSCKEHAAPQPYKVTRPDLGLDHLAGEPGREQHGAGRGLCRKDAWCGGAHDLSLACPSTPQGSLRAALWITVRTGLQLRTGSGERMGAERT